MAELPYDWAESVYLDGVSDDGRTAFVVRLARYPGRGQAWLWAHIFLPDGSIYGYVEDTLPLTGYQGITDVEQRDVTYTLETPHPVTMRRVGRRAELELATLTVSAPAHLGADTPLGPGSLPITIQADFRPSFPGAEQARGRSEVHGLLRAGLTTPAGAVALTGRGQWHEQHGERPRFARGFTYLMLRGEQASFVGTVQTHRQGGTLMRAEGSVTSAAITIDPPGPERHLRIVLADGGVVEGVARVTHRYSVPVEGRRRPGSVVVAETTIGRLTGHINDWPVED